MVGLNEIVDDLLEIIRRDNGLLGEYKLNELSFVEEDGELICLANKCRVPIRVYPDGTIQIFAQDLRNKNTIALAQKVMRRRDEKLALETGAEISDR